MVIASNSIVLKNPPPCDQMNQSLVRLLAYQVESAIGVFFHPEKTFERAPGVNVYSYWSPLRTEVDIRLVCDETIGTSYINVSAPDAGLVTQILDELTRHLATVPLTELVEEARYEGSERTFLRLGLGVRGAIDQAAAEVIRDGLVASNPARRRAAAMAAGLGKWPELGESVRAALAREENKEIWGLLEMALGLQTNGDNGV